MTENSGVRGRKLPVVLQQFWVGTIALCLLALAIAYFCNQRLLFPPEHHFIDLYIFKNCFRFYGTKAFYLEVPGDHTRWTYPNTMAFFYAFFYAIPHPLVAYLSIVTTIVGVGVAAFVQQLRNRGIAIRTALAFALTMVVSSYPLWFLIEAANMEIFVLLLAGLGLVAYLTGRTWWAGALFGLAASLKLFPVVYLALLCSKKNYRKMLFGLAVGAAYYLGSNWLVGPTLMEALKGTNSGLSAYAMYYIGGIRAPELGWDHSLFALVKHFYLVKIVLIGPMQMKMPQIYQMYLVTLAVSCTALYFAKVRKMPPLNQALAITVLSLILPAVSWDYRLVHLYVPWAFLVFFLLDEHKDSSQSVVLLLFAFVVLFTPQSFLYYWLGKYGVAFAVRYGAQVKTLVMLGVLYLSLRYPLVRNAEASLMKAQPPVLQKA